MGAGYLINNSIWSLTTADQQQWGWESDHYSHNSDAMTSLSPSKARELVNISVIAFFRGEKVNFHTRMGCDLQRERAQHHRQRQLQNDATRGPTGANNEPDRPEGRHHRHHQWWHPREIVNNLLGSSFSGLLQPAACLTRVPRVRRHLQQWQLRNYEHNKRYRQWSLVGPLQQTDWQSQRVYQHLVSSMFTTLHRKGVTSTNCKINIGKINEVIKNIESIKNTETTSSSASFLELIDNEFISIVFDKIFDNRFSQQSRRFWQQKMITITSSSTSPSLTLMSRQKAQQTAVERQHLNGTFLR